MDDESFHPSQLPLHPDYPHTCGPDCLDHFPTHAQHTAFAQGGAVDLRRDVSLQQSVANAYTFATTNTPRSLTEAGIASETSSFRPTHHLGDSASIPITTSPTSVVPGIPFPSYSHTNYTHVPSFPSNAHALVPSSSYARSAFPPISDSVASGLLTRSYRVPSMPEATTTGHRDTFTDLPSMSRTQLSPSTFGSVFPALGNAMSYAAPMPSTGQSTQSGGGRNESLDFPFPHLTLCADVECDGREIDPELCCRVEKGFFTARTDHKWTCYRRNYFAVQCSYSFRGHIPPNARLYLRRNDRAGRELIKALGIRLSAAVDGSSGKSIELVQHTPKRDNGPKLKVEIVKVSPGPCLPREPAGGAAAGGMYHLPLPFQGEGNAPAPAPTLDLQMQHEPDPPPGIASNSKQGVEMPQSLSSASGPGMQPSGFNQSHTYERVQFKQATANNGKRRASQQYFYLILELHADVRPDGAEAPVWIKVAQRASERMVVRGRSPSHYSAENQGGSHNGRSGSGGSAAGPSAGGGQYAPGPAGGSTATYGSLSSDGYRAANPSYGAGADPGTMGGYRVQSHGGYLTEDVSPLAHTSGHVGAGALDDVEPLGGMFGSEADRSGIPEGVGYAYYPGPIYEKVQPHLPVPKVESSMRYATEPRSYAVRTEYVNAVPGSQWQAAGCKRFEAVESSRGYYPQHLQANPP